METGPHDVAGMQTGSTGRNRNPAVWVHPANAYPDSCRTKVEYTRDNVVPTTTLFGNTTSFGTQ